MNVLDAALLAVILVSCAVGVGRGLVREVFGVVSFAVSLVLAYVLGPALLSVVAGAAAGPVAYLGSCAAVFVISMLGLAVVSRLVSGLLRVLHLGAVDRGLGLLFGLGRALLLTVSALVVAVLVMDTQGATLRESAMLRLQAPAVEWLGLHIPHDGVRSEFERRWMALAPVPLLEVGAGLHSSVAGASNVRLAR